MKKFLMIGLLVLLAGCGNSKEVDVTDDSVSVEDRLTAVVHDVVGEKAGDKKTVDKIENTDGNVVLDINSKAHEGSKDKLLKDSGEIFSNIAKMDDVSSATINWKAPLTDEYGKERMGDIMSVTIDEETFKKVNWDNYEDVNFESVATKYQQHPALKN